MAWLTAVRVPWALGAQPTMQAQPGPAWPGLHSRAVREIPTQNPSAVWAAWGQGWLCLQRPPRGDPREESDAKQNRRTGAAFPGYHSNLLSQVRFLLPIPR